MKRSLAAIVVACVALFAAAAYAAPGAIEGVPTYQAGKIDRVEARLAEQGLSLENFDDVVFYSDSTNDLPLLERVRTPIATNPTRALAAIARERGED